MQKGESLSSEVLLHSIVWFNFAYYFVFDFIAFASYYSGTTPWNKYQRIIQPNAVCSIFLPLKKQAFSLETQVVGSLLCTVSAFALMNWSHLQGAVASSLCAVATAQRRASRPWFLQVYSVLLLCNNVDASFGAALTSPPKTNQSIRATTTAPPLAGDIDG